MLDVQAAAVVEVLSRKRRRRNLFVWSMWVVITVLILALWQALSGRVVSAFWISSPTLVAGKLGSWFGDGSIWRHLEATVVETAIGFAIGTVLALIVGLLLGMSPLLLRILSPFLTAMYAVPKITLGPLLILYFGIGREMKVVLTTVIAFFLIFYSTLEAVRSVDHDLIAVVRVSGASKSQLVRTTMLPSALGGILAGMRVALPYTLQGALFGEIIASNAGLGYLIQFSSSQFDLTGVFAALIIVTVIAVVLNQLVDWLERWSQRWRPE